MIKESQSGGEKKHTNFKSVFAAALLGLNLLSGGCNSKPTNGDVNAYATPIPTITVPFKPEPTTVPPEISTLVPTPTPTPTSTPEPTATSTPEPTATSTSTSEPTPIVEEKLSYFSVEGVSNNLNISLYDPRVANNGPDDDRIDHKNPFMPESAAWLVLADPGHYRVDSLANVTDPNVRQSIENDIRNGAAYEGDDYKAVLLGPEANIPLFESGGAAILTGAQMQIELENADGKKSVFQLGRQDNHAWVVVLANGLNRDQVRGTDVNRSVKLSQYDQGFTMWQGIPPGMFVSAQYVCQTIADAHGNYKDRGTSPGQGLDGVETVSVLVAKILPEGVAYTVLQHNNPNVKWENYSPDQFKVFASNTEIK